MNKKSNNNNALREAIREEIKNALNEGGTGISEDMWVKELTGKTIKNGSLKTSGPDLMLKMTDGTIYTFKQMGGLVKWDK
jgi:hypothetical protein